MSQLDQARQHLANQNWNAAAANCEAAIQAQADNHEAAYLLAIAYMNIGRLGQAIAILTRLTANFPDQDAARQVLAAAYQRAGRPTEAASQYRWLAGKHPDSRQLKLQLTTALLSTGNYAEATEICRALLADDDQNTSAWTLLSTALRENGQDAGKVLEAAQRAVQLSESSSETLIALGHAQIYAGSTEQAEATFVQVLEIARSGNPVFQAEAANGLALSRARQGRLEEALEIYREIEAKYPHHIESLLNHGQVLYELGHLNEALARLATAINLMPDVAKPRLQAARVLLEVGRNADARGHLEHVMGSSLSADLLSTLGAIDIQEQKYEAALARFEQALASDPNHSESLFGYLTTAQKICHWQGFDAHLAKLLDQFRQNKGLRLAPWGFINLPGTTPADHLECARRQADALTKSTRPSSAPRRKASDRIRVGFLTCDFHTHPTSFLIAEMLDALDQQHFEWHAYYWGPFVEDPIQERIFQSLDHVHHLHELSDSQAVKLIEDNHIDILVDLKGYTQQSRPFITAQHPAPVQINWLGHPQTMGRGMADYIVVDKIICPDGWEQYYSERVLRMPHSYLPSPREQEVEAPGNRAEHKLPDDVFIFGCFNQSQKITPQTFKLWCEILRAVPHSVLWLLEDNHLASTNLIQEASKLGITAERLIFADKRPHAEHLGRLQHMDLMLDTLTYNAHTTASDALSQGVPVITRIGETFPARVCASLLHACELDELICEDDARFVELAVTLAQDRQRLQALRDHLQRNHDRLPLFDSSRFARDFEHLLKQAHTERMRA